MQFGTLFHKFHDYLSRRQWVAHLYRGGGTNLASHSRLPRLSPWAPNR